MILPTLCFSTCGTYWQNQQLQEVCAKCTFCDVESKYSTSWEQKKRGRGEESARQLLMTLIVDCMAANSDLIINESFLQHKLKHDIFGKSSENPFTVWKPW